MRTRPGTRRWGGMAALWLAAVAAPAATAGAAIRIEIGTVAGPPGAEVVLPVRLHTNGEQVVGLRHDLPLPAGIQVAPRPGAPDRPHCRIDPALLPGDAGAGFFWRADGCREASCGIPVAEVVTSFAPLPDALLYTCTLVIAADAGPGRRPIDCTFIEAAAAGGTDVAAACAAGAVIVDAALPAVSPTPTAVLGTPTPTATACPDCGPLVVVGEVRTLPGERPELPIRLRTGRERIAGIQFDLTVPPPARIAARADRQPDCAFGDALQGWSSVTFQPPGVAPELAQRLRALLITLELTPIADDAVVLRCAVEVAGDALPGSYALPLSEVDGSEPDGTQVPLPGRAGALHVLAPPEGQQPVVDGGGARVAASGCAVAAPAAPSWAPLLGLLTWLAARRRAPR